MRTVLFHKNVGSSHRKMPSRNRCSPKSILDFGSKLMEGTKYFRKFLQNISKGVRFYKAAVLQPIYLLKSAFLLEKILMQSPEVFCKKRCS